MSQYICHNSLVHDKPCTAVQVIMDTPPIKLPSSNNGFIYTAYYYHYCLAPVPLPQVEELDYEKIANTSLNCVIDNPYDDFIIRRLPDKDRPPISRDELFGKFALRTLSIETLMDNDWYFYNTAKIGIAPFYRQVNAIVHVAWPEEIKFERVNKWYRYKLKITPKHRNYIWVTKLYDAYPISFRVAPYDRHAFRVAHNNRNGEEQVNINLFEMIVFYLYYLSTLIKGTAGEKNFCWLQCELMGKYKMAKWLNPEKNFLEYFKRVPDHPIVEYIKSRQGESNDNQSKTSGREGIS